MTSRAMEGFAAVEKIKVCREQLKMTASSLERSKIDFGETPVKRHERSNGKLPFRDFTLARA
jgi:hypothetical protein